MKPIEQLLGFLVAIKIDVVKRMAVPCQKLLDAERAGTMCRANHDDVPEIVGNHLESPEDERAHQDLAQLGVGLHEVEQLLPFELEHFAGLADPQTSYRTAATDHVAFAGELSGAVAYDERLPSFGRSQDLN